MIQLGLCPNLSTMTIDDALHECKTDSGSGKFFLAMQPLENPEKFTVMPHVETGTVVFYIVDRLALRALLGADLKLADFPLFGEFQRVAEQVHPYLPDQRF